MHLRKKPGRRQVTSLQCIVDYGLIPSGGRLLPALAGRHATEWGPYEPAVRRWEGLTRPVPPPTQPTGKNGAQRLSPFFVEWMMGLRAGWVTGTPGIGRVPQLKLLGNGVVPQQAALALRLLMERAGIAREEPAAAPPRRLIRARRREVLYGDLFTELDELLAEA